MNKKLVCLAVFILFLPVVLFAQSQEVPASQDYWMDEEGRFHQVIRWTRTNALYYDVELERRDNTGRWLPVESRRTEDTLLELILPPGVYRFRVHTYNVLERLVGTSDWTEVRVYEAKAPGADRLPMVEATRGETTFTVMVSGEALVEGAEVVLIPRKKNPASIKPLLVEFSFDETWIRAEFSAGDVTRGTYDLVIINPGGLSQTVGGVKVKFVRPRPVPGIAGAFDLDNTRGWSLGAAGNVGLNLDPYLETDYEGGSSAAIFGAALDYTFFEKFRNYGERFWLPNSFFAELSYTGKNHTMSLGIETTQWTLTLEAGALYKIRLGQAQRVLLSFGLGIGGSLGFYEDSTGAAGTKTHIFMNVLRLGLSYRITPAWSADIGANAGSPIYASNTYSSQGARPAMVNISLGATYRGFY